MQRSSRLPSGDSLMTFAPEVRKKRDPMNPKVLAARISNMRTLLLCLTALAGIVCGLLLSQPLLVLILTCGSCEEWIDFAAEIAFWSLFPGAVMFVTGALAAVAHIAFKRVAKRLKSSEHLLSSSG